MKRQSAKSKKVVEVKEHQKISTFFNKLQLKKTAEQTIDSCNAVSSLRLPLSSTSSEKTDNNAANIPSTSTKKLSNRTIASNTDIVNRFEDDEDDDFVLSSSGGSKKKNGTIESTSKNSQTKIKIKSPKIKKTSKFNNKNKNKKQTDDSELLIDLEATKCTGNKDVERKLSDNTPEKTYLQCDDLLPNISMCKDKIQPLQKIYQSINFQKSNREASPPHSTPLESVKKRKALSPDIIPETPEPKLLSKSKYKYSKERRQSNEPNLSSVVEELDIPDMVYKSPPKKKIKMVDESKTIINLSDICASDFEKVHSLTISNKTTVKVSDGKINSLLSKDSNSGIPNLKESTSESDFPPPVLINNMLKSVKSVVNNFRTGSDDDVISINSSTLSNKIESPNKKVPILDLDKTTESTPTKILNMLASCVTANRSPLQTLNLNENTTCTPVQDPKTPPKKVISHTSLKSTSPFDVTEVKFISPSRNGHSKRQSPIKSTNFKKSLFKNHIEFEKDFTSTPKCKKLDQSITLNMEDNIENCSHRNVNLVGYDLTDQLIAGVDFEESFAAKSQDMKEKNKPIHAITDNLNFDDDSWDMNFETNETINNLNLEQWTYCIVQEIEKDEYNNLILKLESPDDKKTTTCMLQGVWRETKVSEKDTVNVIAFKISGKASYCVNNDQGYLVYSPDLLISGTSIVGSLFCKRRGVLSDNFRLTDDSKIMLIGSLIHTLLENVLKKKIYDTNQMEKLLMSILSENRSLKSLHSNKTDIEEIRNQILPFLPKIKTFLDVYVLNSKKSTNHLKKPEDWKGSINFIEDIEENIWCTKFGIKGKVDVTVRTSPNNVILPLELKTGKASMSLEHRGQVILYTMIMTELGYDVDSGILLYLRENVLREVKSNHCEKRDLIILRNDLAYYLMQKPKFVKLKNIENLQKYSNLCDDMSERSGTTTMSEESVTNEIVQMKLPEPINHPNACKKCPYNTICSVYLRQDNFMDISESHPLHEISKASLLHLSPEHIEFFLHWTSLLSLEYSYKPSHKEIKDIWRLPPEKREEKGSALCFLKLLKNVTEEGDSYVHIFTRSNEGPIEYRDKHIQSSGLAVGNYVIVSSNKRISVAAGFVTFISKEEIHVSLERNLNVRYSNTVFHLDTYESKVTLAFSMSSMVALLDSTERAKRIRELVIDKAIPDFVNKLPRTVPNVGRNILRRLNKIQQRAVLKAITAEDYLLIKGMPGSGKTATIVALIQLLVELKKTVLITSHTHSAVDNVCLRLVDCGVDVLRLGNESRIHPALRSKAEYTRTAHCKSVAEIQAVYNSVDVIAVTCWMAGHAIFAQRQIDVCIVDESTQVVQPSIFKALLVTNKFVLVGDPDQLPPVVSNPKAAKRGMDQSLFERLASPTSTIMLTLQYRMNKTITALANAITYKGQLLCADDSVGFAVLRVPKIERIQTLYREEQWLINLLDTNLKYSVMALDTGSTWNLGKENCAEKDLLERIKVPSRNVEEEEERICSNYYEAAIIVTIVQALREGGLLSSAIGIIAPFRAQVTLLSKLLSKITEGEDESIEVNTVDQYQGRDKEIIIYSCTKSRNLTKIKQASSFEILDDKRRLTVAITRAKHKLIMIGDFGTLKEYTPFNELINNLEDEQKLLNVQDKFGFEWEKVINRVKQLN